MSDENTQDGQLPQGGDPSNAPSPAPLLRPPILGQRGSGGRTPRLGLSIPPSPGPRPVNQPGSDIPPLQTGSRPSSRIAPPQLHLNTPMGSSQAPQTTYNNGLPATASSGGSARSREGSFGQDAHGLGPSAQSSASSAPLSIRTPGRGTPDPSSAISAYSDHNNGERGAGSGAGEIKLPDLAKLRLDKGRDLDVDDLDDEGWMAASKDGLIEELGTLGEGAGGAVKRCRLKEGKTAFALKVITTDPDPDMQKQIRRELEFNKRIADVHICRYYGAYGDSSSGLISIIMEYCEGGSLDAVYKEVKKLGGRIGEKVLGKVAEGSLAGLTYLYSMKIIHRDIKPSNILLNRDGTVKLCDFGVSGEFGTRGDANTFIGTSYYMAPERITGQSYNITSDVWSLGVTLLEVAQHRFPFGSADSDGPSGVDLGPAGPIDIIQYIVSKPLPQLKDEEGKNGEEPIKWSENFKEFIDRCLERNPSRRATPWRMLEHPWMEDMKAKKVNMGRFLQQVWNWTD